jgi:bacteriorhodopsin
MNLEKYESSLQFLSNKNNLLKKTFSITYTLLLTTAVITFIEAIRTPNSKIRHILNLETCISFVASYFYSLFITQVNDKNIDWNNITQTRYIDWSVTTPMMLLALCLVLSMNTNTVIHINTIILIVILNYTMLLFGYLAEIGKISFEWGAVLGFLPFFAFFYLIYENYAKHTTIGQMTFVYFIAVWGLYGVASLFSYKYKNIAYKVLDLFSKNFFGVFLAVVLLLNKPQTE